MSTSFRNLLSSAGGRVIRNWEVSLTLILCFTAILFPLITALAISKGLRCQALISVQSGPAWTMVGEKNGSSGPISEAALKALEEELGLSGKKEITGRIIGRTTFINRVVALAGLDPSRVAGPFPLDQGRQIHREKEVLVGFSLAKTFHLHPGVQFSLPANPGVIFTVAGVLKPASLWDSELLVMSLSEAQTFFRKNGFVTEAAVATLPLPSDRIQGLEGKGLIPREKAHQWLNKGYQATGGIFIPFWIMLAALTIPALLISSGLGQSETTREISLLFSLGWSRTEMMVFKSLECGIISLGAAALATLCSLAWMKGANGMLIARFFVAEVGLVPDFPIPTRYLPLPTLAGWMFVFLITWIGSLAAVWSGTKKAPYGALR
jgi:ABC-type lipoprotein release transport system permease subunit